MIIANLLFAIVSLVGFPIPELVIYFGIISLIASVLQSVYQSQEGKNTLKRHMTTGEEYLRIHYERQELFYSQKAITRKIRTKFKSNGEMSSKDKPTIHQLGIWFPKRAMEKNGEMKTWWK